MHQAWLAHLVRSPAAHANADASTISDTVCKQPDHERMINDETRHIFARLFFTQYLWIVLLPRRPGHSFNFHWPGADSHEFTSDTEAGRKVQSILISELLERLDDTAGIEDENSAADEFV